jgi:hypothetical protein
MTNTPEPAGAPGTPALNITLPQLLLGLGAVLLIVSNFLHWIDVTGPSGSLTGDATNVPVTFLFDKGTHSNDPTILILLIPAALLLAGGAFRFRSRAATIVGSAVALAVVVLYCIQVQRGLDDELSSANLGLTDFIGIGTYMAAIGGALGLVGSLIQKEATAASPPPVAPAA